MKAVRFHQHGDPGVLVYEDAPDPSPPAGWAIVKVRACALNHLDLFQRRGLDRVKIPLPHISGADICGVVVDPDPSTSLRAGPSTPLRAGPAVAEGQRVMVQPGLSCGRCARCLAGEDNFCPAYDVLGYQSNGGYAEYVAVPQANLIPLPDHVTDVEAAAFPLAFLTAWHMLFTRAQLKPSETVLVLAAGSGVGQAAVQLAHAHRARVIATAGSEAKLAKARELGADEVVNHYGDDLVSTVKTLTANRGVDVVVEHVGAATWERSVRCLARGGRIVTCGATTGFEARLDLRHLFARQLSLLGSYMGAKHELLQAVGLFFKGVVRPTVDCTYPLADAAHAHMRLESSEQFGKIVLVVENT